jgi:3-oxoacyl-[acyl-carrier protein] reductase
MEAKEKRVAIVTGASRGIGAAIAARLGAQAINVVVTYRQDWEGANKTAEKIQRLGGEAKVVAADVTQSKDVKRLFDEAAGRWGRLDIVVNNAGYAQHEQIPIAETSDELFDRTFASNARSAFLCMREAARLLHEGGRVINMSSSGTAAGHPGHGAYNAAKSGVELLTRVFAKEMAGRRVTVNCVAPGATATDSWLEGKPPKMLEMIAGLSPLHRLGTPQDIAEVVGFLVTPEAEWINGQTIRLNGGFI